MNWNPISKITDSATALLGVGERIIDTLFTSEKEKVQKKIELIKALKSGDLKEAEKQLDKLRAFAADRADARTMYQRTRTWIVPFLAVAFTGGFFAVIFWVLYYGVPDGQSQVTWMLVGTLQTATVTILTFFFGRTDREDEKDFAAAYGQNKRSDDMPNQGPKQATPTMPAPTLDTSGLDEMPLAQIDTDDNA